MKSYENASLSPKERAQALLAELSPEEKLAQLQCFYARKPDLEPVDAECPNGIGQISPLCFRLADSLQ